MESTTIPNGYMFNFDFNQKSYSVYSDNLFTLAEHVASGLTTLVSSVEDAESVVYPTCIEDYNLNLRAIDVEFDDEGNCTPVKDEDGKCMAYGSDSLNAATFFGVVIGIINSS